ncbi:DMT family transporter [Pseudomonas zhanjiangensis]|uniref:DMT family transporter n=1 Tax=Pseudomonas zhanjiangensis TaxID=3239015 RepID=A0ABV3YV88_9PSED
MSEALVKARADGTEPGVARGIGLCLLAMLVFASQDAITKVLVQEFAVAQFVMLRYWLFVVFALVYCHWHGGVGAAWRSGLPWLQLLRSLLAVGEIAIFSLGLRYLGLAESHALFAIFPLLALALARLWLGEFVGLRRWLAAAVGFLGTLVILRPGLGLFEPAALIPLSAALSFAVYNLVTRRVSQTDGFTTNMLYMAVVGALASSAFGLPAWRDPAPEEWGLMGILSVSGIAAHLLLIKALAYAPAAVLQPFNYSLLVFAMLIGLLVFGEFPDAWTLAGAALVVAGGLYAIGASPLRKQLTV